MKIDNLFAELKRRNVYKVAVAYAVVAWLLIQAASILFPTFDAPPWVMKVFVVVVILGFVPALIFSWAFEITPGGIKRETEIATATAVTRQTGRRIVAFTAVLAMFAGALFLYQRFRPVGLSSRDARKIQEASAQATSATGLPVPEKSIAVLPFDNLSDEKSNAYFAEGIQDEILTRLAKVADLKVIARTSTQKFKSAPENLPDIARQLGAANILEGSVQKVNDQVRVNVQLINALTNAHLWAEIYDRKLTDIFSVESEIAKTIADMLQAKLSGSEKTAISKKPTADPEAYELYLQGRFFWNKRTATDLRKSIDYFNQAIAKDPNYALAYAGLAQAWMVLSAYNGGAPADCTPKAEAAARKALAIDNALSDAVAVLASVKAEYDFDFAGAFKEYERVIQLNPNDATAHHWFATDVLASTGQHERELAEMKRALELDPLSLVINTNVGNAYVHNGRLDEAVAQLRKAMEMDGSFYFAQWSYGLALELQGKIPDAIAQLESATAMTDDPAPMAFLGHIYAVVGRNDEARKILERLRELRTRRYTPAYLLGLVSVGLGDRATALDWLEESYRERDGNDIGWIRIDPLLDPLHDDPRFQALAEKIVPAQLFQSSTRSK